MKTKNQKVSAIQKLKRLVRNHDLQVKSETYRLSQDDYDEIMSCRNRNKKFICKELAGEYWYGEIGGHWYPLYAYNGCEKSDLSPKGGYTRVILTELNGTSHVGEAVCHPNDNYDHKVGFLKALGRAIRKIDIKNRRKS